MCVRQMILARGDSERTVVKECDCQHFSVVVPWSRAMFSGSRRVVSVWSVSVQLKTETADVLGLCF